MTVRDKAGAQYNCGEWIAWGNEEIHEKEEQGETETAVPVSAYGGDFDFDTIRMIALDLDGTTLTKRADSQNEGNLRGGDPPRHSGGDRDRTCVCFAAGAGKKATGPRVHHHLQRRAYFGCGDRRDSLLRLHGPEGSG